MQELESIVGCEMASLLEPEHALVLALSRRDLTPGQVSAVRAAIEHTGDEFSWGKFVDTCARHGLLPLVGHHIHALDITLGSTGQSTVPYRWLYSHIYDANRQRNQILAVEYGHVIRRLEDSKIQFIVRKGPVFLDQIHGDYGIRRVGDMDLLVSRSDLARLEACLQREGYRCAHRTSDRHDLTPFDRSTSAFWKLNMPNVHLPYLKVADSDLVEVFVLDLCLSLFQARSGLEFDFDDFYQRSVPTRVWGRPSRAMHPIDQLVDVCVQMHIEATSLYYIELGKDTTLLKLTELAELVRLHLNDDAAVSAIAQRSDSLGCRSSVFYALWHVRELYPDRVAKSIVEKLGAGIDRTMLETFGDLDGDGQIWENDFVERLFVDRRATSSRASTVPGPRAVI